MMKKIFTTLAVISAIYFNAQTIIPDNTFGTSGIYSFVNQTTGDSIIESIIQPDGKIIVAGQRINGANNSEVYVSRLNSNGTLDTTFGVNGFFTGYQNSSSYATNLYYVNDKIVIFYPEQGVLVKLNSNGTPDTSFGTNGILAIGNTLFGRETALIGNTLYATRENSLNKIDITTGSLSTILISSIYSIKSVYVGPNGSLLLESLNNSTFTNLLTLVNPDGIINTTFGTNGTITTNVSPTLNDFENSYDYVAVDNSNNIYYALTNESNLTGTVKKFDVNGNSVSTFGTNGTYQFINNIFSDLKILSNQIYLSGININGSNLNLFLARLNSDGTLDNGFDNDGIYVFDTNTLNEWAESLNVISPTTIIVAGEYTGTNNTTFVGKFLVTPNLSTSEVKTNDLIWFENPVKSNITFKSNEKIEKIELYSIGGKLVKTIYNNNSQISELVSGIYIAKIKLQNGQSVTKKIIKK